MERSWSCLDCQFEDADPVCLAEDGTCDFKRLADVLLKIATATELTGNGERMRAYDCVDEMVQTAPEAAVEFIIAALDECRTGAHVALLSAGALETLLKTHGAKVIGPLEEAARKHAKMRYLLSATWGEASMVPAVWRRLIAAVAPGPVMDADARTPAAGMHDRILNGEALAALLAEPMQTECMQAEPTQ
ncbi:MAG TPA: hypothetical protein VNR88_11130 [Hyphomicrobium sp.]|nr:hypothetical protein [Hyphomicrobium sp.]